MRFITAECNWLCAMGSKHALLANSEMSQNHKMVWFGRNLEDNLVPPSATPPPCPTLWTGTQTSSNPMPT